MITRVTVAENRTLKFIAHHPDNGLPQGTNLELYTRIFELALERKPWLTDTKHWVWHSPKALVKETKRIDGKTNLAEGLKTDFVQLNVMVRRTLAEDIKRIGAEVASQHGYKLATFLYSVLRWALVVFYSVCDGKLDPKGVALASKGKAMPPATVVKIPAFKADASVVRKLLEAMGVRTGRIMDEDLAERLVQVIAQR